MSFMLRDFYGHQAWADAEHWRAIGPHLAARADRTIRARLHHIGLVQRMFLWSVGDQMNPFAFTTSDDFPSFDDLKAWSREYHSQAARFMEMVSDAHLAETVTAPWFKPSAAPITVAEALMQCAMHSHYHRGQNAARLRELGGEPPTTDLIVWYWQARPAPTWAEGNPL